MNTVTVRALGTASAALGALLVVLAGWSGAATAQTCENTCATANDGECDDGGTGAMYALCGYGTDCADCGTRPSLDPVSAQRQRWAGGCDDSCGTAHDGECDDGGPTSLYSVCRLGSDCSDCGPREAIDPATMGWVPSATGCDNTCSTAFDGECDDGGPSSMYGLCPLGTDCNDCGSRNPAYTGALPPGYTTPSPVIPPTTMLPTPTPPTGGLVCGNTCRWANDGECDDGGPDSMYALCVYGSDCGDCGPRARYGSGGSVAPTPPTPTPSYTTGQVCMNTCEWANDGECDDGGIGSMYALCAYGSDCGDCGPRPSAGGTVPVAPPTPTPTYGGGGVCSNTCQWANDGECDDGGPGSLYNVCEYGSDCGDCGPRDLVAAVPPTPSYPTPSAGAGICADSCPYARDGACDDGGPGAMSDICAYGTDCEDCGPRAAAEAMPPEAEPPTGIPEPSPRAIPAPTALPDLALCSDSCDSANDDECDDGGPGAQYSVCGYGTDCSDCGPRPPIDE